MTSLLEAVLLGTIQGIAEWLPISSSGHLVLARLIFGLNDLPGHDIWLHLASLIVIIITFRKEYVSILKGALASDRHSLNLCIAVLIGTIPLALAGIALKQHLGSFYSDPILLGISFLVTSVVLLLSRGMLGRGNITFGRAIIIGFFQALALFPGISRSGMTIAAALLLGVKRETAALFSFLLFVPAILGALFLEGTLIPFSFPLFISFITALIIGSITLPFLLTLVQKGRIWAFGTYTACIGIAIITSVLI